MILAEIHEYKPTYKDYNELDNLCFLSKNLYNATLYDVRQYYFKTKKHKHYNEVNKEFVRNNQYDYRMLPAKVSQQVQRLVESNFNSFFALAELKKKGKYNKKVSMPNYLHKTKGRQIVPYTKQAFSYNNGIITLSKTNIHIKTNLKKKEIQAIRITPCNGSIKIEILYNVQENKLRKENNNIASIDLGINNLMTVAFTNRKPLIINGRPIKSINQFFNKESAKYKSLAKKCNDIYSTERLKRLSVKRRNKINDYLHKAISFLLNQLVENNITTLICGYNKDLKQDSNMGKVNNQNFVSIPYLSLVEMLEYKCKLYEIHFIIQEESYTSKSSFIDNDELPIYNPNDEKEYKFSGNRIHRGLYKTKNGIKINADVNGAYNIMRKVVGENLYKMINLIEVCSTPRRYTF